MHRHINLLLLVLFFFLSLVPCHGEENNFESPEDTALRLQSRYDTITSITFNFYQDTRGDMTGRPRRGSGRGTFYRDENHNFMRWDYASPDRQVLLSDGTIFSMYFSKLQQLIVSPAENFDSDLTYSFFTGRGNLQRDFHIRPADLDSQPGKGDEYAVIKLIPRSSHSQIQDIHLWITDDSLIRRIQLHDHFGTLTVLNLSDIKIDTLTDLSAEELKALFSFTPPEGTEIIHQ